MSILRALRRALGSITQTSDGGGAPIEMENSGALPVSLYIKTTNPGDTLVTAVGLPMTDGWHPSWQSEVTANDSDKTFTVTAAKEWRPLSVLVDLVTTATVGNRQMSILLTTGSDYVLAEVRAGTTQAASLTRRYVFGVGMADLTAFRDTSLLTTPLPAMVLPATYKIRVYDKAAVDAAADDMTVQIIVNVRGV